jgi:hypothetical protein
MTVRVKLLRFATDSPAMNGPSQVYLSPLALRHVFIGSPKPDSSDFSNRQPESPKSVQNIPALLFCCSIAAWFP